MDRPPFRFAVQATNATGGREWRDTVRKVEDLGYSTLFLADHYLGPGPAQRAARTLVTTEGGTISLVRAAPPLFRIELPLA